MEVKVGAFAHGYAWLLVKDGRLLEQGFDTDLKTARKQADSAVLFWTTHDYEAD